MRHQTRRHVRKQKRRRRQPHNCHQRHSPDSSKRHSLTGIQRVPAYIGLFFAFIALYIDIYASRSGRRKPYYERVVWELRTVGIPINRHTLIVAQILVDSKITSPRRLRAMAEYGILHGKAAKNLPRWILRNMALDLRTVYDHGYRGYLADAAVVRVDVFKNYVFRRGVRYAALEITVSGNIPEGYSEAAADVLRSVTRGVLVNVLCLVITGCVLACTSYLSIDSAWCSTHITHLYTWLKSLGAYGTEAGVLLGLGIQQVKTDAETEQHGNTDAEAGEIDDCEPDVISLGFKSTDFDYVSQRIDTVADCSDPDILEQFVQDPERLEAYVKQRLSGQFTVSQDADNRDVIPLDEAIKILTATAVTGAGLLEGLTDTKIALDTANGMDHQTSSIPSGADKFGPNGRQTWGGFIGKDKKVNCSGGKLALDADGSLASSPDDAEEFEDPFLAMLHDPEKSVSYLLELQNTEKAPSSKGRMRLPSEEEAKYHLELHYPEKCDACSHRPHCEGLKKATSCGTYNNVRPEIVIHVDKHKAMKAQCPVSGEMLYGKLPDGHNSGKGYDDIIVANAIHATLCGNASRRNAARIMSAVFGINIGKSSIDNWVRRMADCLRSDGTIEGIKNSLLGEYVLCLDETGRSVNGRLEWIHAVRSPLFMYFHIHKRRGYEGISAEDWLTWYEGYVSHDFWKPYYRLSNVEGHVLCCIHLLRELFGIVSFIDDDFEWAAGMMTLLISAKTLRNEYAEAGKTEFEPYLVETILALYDEYVNMGLAIHPEKTGKVRALLNRLRDHKDEYTRWITDHTIPFTNNLAEQAIRALVIQEKTSGAFRSEDMPEDWMVCMSYIGTCILHKIPAIDAIMAALQHRSAQLLFPEGAPEMPEGSRKLKEEAEEKRRQEAAAAAANAEKKPAANTDDASAAPAATDGEKTAANTDDASAAPAATDGEKTTTNTDDASAAPAATNGKKTTNTDAASAAPADAGTPRKRGRGRPPGSKNKKTLEREAAAANGTETSATNTNTANKTPTDAGIPQKRGRGRPPGSKNKKTL